MSSLVQIWNCYLWGGNWAEIQLTCVHLILVVLAFKAKGEQARVRSCLLKSQGRLASDYKSAKDKQNKGNQSRGKDKQTTKKSLQEAKSSSGLCWSRAGGLKQWQRLLQVISGHVFWVSGCGRPEVDGREEGVCVRGGGGRGGGGRNGPLAIHHGPVFDSPNACSWAASSIIHGYRRPGRSRAFYFSRVNNSCPLTQPRESRNRGTDKQGSRWLVEPFRTSTLFWFRSQRGSLHAHGPRCLPQRGSEGRLVYAGGLCTRAFWSVNIILRNKCRALLRIKYCVRSNTGSFKIIGKFIHQKNKIYAA